MLASWVERMVEFYGRELGFLRKNDDSKKFYEFVWLWFPDILGKVRCLTIPCEMEKMAIDEGIGFDGSSVGFAPVEKSDMFIKADRDTEAYITKEGEIIKRYFSYVLNSDFTPSSLDSRYILKKRLDELKKKHGWEFKVAAEVEFFLLENGKPLDSEIYFGYSNDLGEKMRREIAKRLKEVGIKPQKMHHEVAPGQYEINFKYDDALRTADNVLTFKEIVRMVAREHGLEANFMPKPFRGINGSGMHCHINLTENGKNLFLDEGKEGVLWEKKLSEIGKYFIGGLLAHSKEICAVIAPTVNSYKRLVPGYEAPNVICWGYENRSALKRIPVPTPNSYRIEFRAPDPSCNPYLAFAVILEAGMDGIEKKIDPGKPTDKNAYHLQMETLPGSLEEALREMEKSKIVKKALGSKMYKKFLEIKKKEWEDYKLEVTKWEWEMYSKV